MAFRAMNHGLEGATHNLKAERLRAPHTERKTTFYAAYVLKYGQKAASVMHIC